MIHNTMILQTVARTQLSVMVRSVIKSYAASKYINYSDTLTGGRRILRINFATNY